MSDNGTPLSGTHTIVVKLYKDLSGSAHFQESHSVLFTQGAYELFIGSQNPLKKSDLDSESTYITFTIDSSTESSRKTLAAFPYAYYSKYAQYLGSTATINSTQIVGKITADAVLRMDASKLSGSFSIYTTAPGNSFVMNSSGNVGIKKLNPAYELDVNGTVKATKFIGDGSSLTGLTGTGGVSNVGSTTIGADTDSDGAGSIALQTRGTTKLTVSNNGNIGIGTSAPTNKLEVVGTVNATRFMGDGKYVTGVNTANFAITANVVNASGLRGAIRVSSTAPNGVISINSLGKIGIGKVASAYMMDVAGTINARAIYKDGAPISNYSLDAVNGSTRDVVYVSSSGNVGIGTKTPTSKLEVVGEIKATLFTGDGSGLTGITGGTGGIENTGSTTIASDTDLDGVGDIALQTKGTTKLTIINNRTIFFNFLLFKNNKEAMKPIK